MSWGTCIPLTIYCLRLALILSFYLCLDFVFASGIAINSLWVSHSSIRATCPTNPDVFLATISNAYSRGTNCTERPIGNWRRSRGRSCYKWSCKQCLASRTGFKWLRTGSGGGLVRTKQWISGWTKHRGTSGAKERLLASKEALYTISYTRRGILRRHSLVTKHRNATSSGAFLDTEFRKFLPVHNEVCSVCEALRQFCAN